MMNPPVGAEKRALTRQNHIPHPSISTGAMVTFLPTAPPPEPPVSFCRAAWYHQGMRAAGGKQERAALIGKENHHG
ncbi:MAG: hypothetical protein HPY85_17050 [Anaerolineae bacterium]|nr:hypothetical protein [Anaerolineae bacterium]